MSSGSADPAFGDEPILAALTACPLFAPLPETALRALAGLARRRRYEPAEALFRLGDASDTALVLCSGRCRPRSGRPTAATSCCTARLYAATHPRRVTGLVMVDALSEFVEDGYTPAQ